MSTPPGPPGWSLDHPFELSTAAADLAAAAQLSAQLSRDDDGTRRHAAEIRRVRAVIERLSARIREHNEQ